MSGPHVIWADTPKATFLSISGLFRLDSNRCDDKYKQPELRGDEGPLVSHVSFLIPITFFLTHLLSSPLGPAAAVSHL